MGRVIIPYLNPINFVEVSPKVIPQYVSKFIDDYRWATRLDPQQKGVYPFYQLWQNNDVITLQFQNNAGQITLYLVDCSGKTVDSFPFISKQFNKYDPTYFIYEVNVALTPYPAGRYILYAEIGTPVNTALMSEPIYIKPRHEGSLLYQYKNKQYRGNMIFETGIEPSIRGKSRLKKRAPVSKDTVYEDQVLDMTMVKSKPYRVFDLTLEQIPDWMEEIYNWIFGCSSVKIDGRYFTKNGDDAKFEKGVSAYYGALNDYSIEMRDSMTRNSKIIDTVENTNEELTIQLNVDSKGFADTSENASSSVVTFFDVE